MSSECPLVRHIAKELLVGRGGLAIFTMGPRPRAQAAPNKLVVVIEMIVILSIFMPVVAVLALHASCIPLMTLKDGQGGPVAFSARDAPSQLLLLDIVK